MTGLAGTAMQDGAGERALALVFMGTPDFAATILQSLIDAGHRLLAVYTQPPRPAGRGYRPQPSPVQRLAEENAILVRSPESLRPPEVQAEFAALGADLAVVAAYGLILPSAILRAPRLGCLNVHASLLPRWRGADPACHPCRRPRERRHDHANGGRARHRADPVAAGRADRPRGDCDRPFR